MAEKRKSSAVRDSSAAKRRQSEATSRRKTASATPVTATATPVPESRSNEDDDKGKDKEETKSSAPLDPKALLPVKIKDGVPLPTVPTPQTSLLSIEEYQSYAERYE